MKCRFLEKYTMFGDYEHTKWVEKQAAMLLPGSKILDIGAGSCRYRHLFNHCQYKAHDFAKLEACDVGNGYGELDYISDIPHIPVENGSFDAILCTQVLEHVPEPVLAVKEFARILKPGGILLLTAPQRSGLHQAPYHFYGGYTAFWHKKFLPESGFEILSIEPNGGFFKHYGEAGQQFVAILFPAKRKWRKRVLFPIYLFLKAWAICQGVACHYLDPLDVEKGMTVGYHVRAVKR